MYYKDGDRYDGEWKNDKKKGKGIIIMMAIAMKVIGKMA